MIALFIEALPRPEGRQAYIDLAADLRPLLQGAEGYLSVERGEAGLSLTFRKDGAGVEATRVRVAHLYPS